MYRLPQLVKFRNLLHTFSTVEDGNMANSILGKVTNFNLVLQNRKKFLESIKIPLNSTICMWAEGKDSVLIADPKDAGVSISDYKFAVRTDSLITNQKGLYLFLLVADCAPIIIYDPINEAVGIVHAGWKGANMEIVKKAVESLGDKYKCNPKNLIVGIGPCARKDSYILENPSQVNDPKWKGFVTVQDGDRSMYEVDFVGLCKKQLKDVGVSEKNIYDCGVDTIKDKRFFSHYRDKVKPLNEQGRFACVVGLV